jgi:hypothetical protein
MTLQAGYAQATITPALERPVYLAGFGRNRRALTVHDDLFVRARTSSIRTIRLSRASITRRLCPSGLRPARG